MFAIKDEEDDDLLEDLDWHTLRLRGQAACLRCLLCALSQGEELDAEAAGSLMQQIEDHVREHAREAEEDANRLLRAPYARFPACWPLTSQMPAHTSASAARPAAPKAFWLSPSSSAESSTPHTGFMKP